MTMGKLFYESHQIGEGVITGIDVSGILDVKFTVSNYDGLSYQETKQIDIHEFPEERHHLIRQAARVILYEETLIDPDEGVLRYGPKWTYDIESSG